MSQKNRVKLSQSIARLMPNIIQGVHIGFLAKRNLTHTQFFVLVAIHSQNRPAMRTLSTNMQVSMPTMSGIIERLVKAGYVKRVPHPEDRRHDADGGAAILLSTIVQNLSPPSGARTHIRSNVAYFHTDDSRRRSK